MSEPKVNRIINIEEFKLNSKYNFTSCTAEWCNPCKRIKPHVLQFIAYKEKISESKIDQKQYQETINKYIPYFIITDLSDKKKYCIQTSDADELKKFMDDFQSVSIIDENF